MKDDNSDAEEQPPITQPKPTGTGGGGSGRKVIGAGTGGSSDDERSPIPCAEREARRLGHNFVGTAFILLGLIACSKGVTRQAINSVGLDLEQARKEVESIVGKGNGVIVLEMPFTPGAKKTLELAWEQARELGHNYIGSEHILLALMMEDDSGAARVMKKLRVPSLILRQALLTLLTKNRD